VRVGGIDQVGDPVAVKARLVREAYDQHRQ
jgi:hypothetical protein